MSIWNELKFKDTFELIELLDRNVDWQTPQMLELRDEIQRRLQFAEDNGVMEGN